MKKAHVIFCSAAMAATSSFAASGETALRAGFANPPSDVKIGCYYYWVNERVDEEGVKKDLQWMKENGITRAFLATDIRNRTRFENPWEGQQFGDCTFRSEKWWRCLRTAFKTAGELGIEMGIFNCPGWSQSGGPWVAKEDAHPSRRHSHPLYGAIAFRSRFPRRPNRNVESRFLQMNCRTRKSARDTSVADKVFKLPLLPRFSFICIAKRGF